MVMDKFESQFADLDVQTNYMEATMSDTTALATPQDQVDQLIDQVADEAGLEVRQGLGEAKVPAAVPKETEGETRVAVEEDGRLADRLRALRVSLHSHEVSPFSLPRLGVLESSLMQSQPAT